jgi:ATP phosphoribosyltransferase regulatory subunit
LSADLEVLLIALEALDRLGVGDAILTVGHAGFVLGLLEQAGVPESARPDLLDGVRARDEDRIHAALGCEPPPALLEAMDLCGSGEVLGRARAIASNRESRSALSHLEVLASELDALGVGQRFQFDLGEVLGFDYYTGMVFEIHAPGAGLALGGGGRYDSLIGKFGLSRPAVGFSLCLDRLAQAVSVGEVMWAEKEQPQTVALGETPSKALSEALAIRRQGRKVQMR